MSESSRPWSGIVTGDSGPYSDDQWSDIFATFLAHIVASQGVWEGQLNELVASGAVTPVAINTGRALVDGVWYESDASEDVAIPSPAVNPRVDRIVLRKDWALQTVRLTRLAGAESALQVPPAPALVQNDGVTWDLPLWQIHITVGGVITLWHDEREFIGQYVPADFVSETLALIDDDFFGPNWVDGESRNVWLASIAASGNIDALDEVGFGTGAITLGHDGVNANDGAQLSAGTIRPELINAHQRFSAKEPNSDANLDRLIGYSDQVEDVTPTNGIFFRAVGVGNWFAVTRIAGVETAQDTGQALTNVWKTFEIKQQAASVVTFLIDDVIVAVSTTDIPSAPLTAVVIEIIDSGVAPAANQYQHVDYMRVKGAR
ncbi:hypothetical protein LCGC14_2230380 [marine sediment metagenome]|uniref:Minor tail protein n=1 Tax=marine sediment metagenome TaxID=412755 RepID=A0A0F9FL07_9ZZZZ